MAELADPYDPVANVEYRFDGGLHDLSYVDGKVYSYFGPAPVLLLFLPFRILHVGELSPTLATLLFGIGGFLASWGAFRVLAARFIGRITVGLEAMAMLALGLAAPIGWLIYIGRAYEVPIACGYFLVMLGLFLLCRGLFSATARPVLHLVFAILALAGAVAARPTLVWCVLFRSSPRGASPSGRPRRRSTFAGRRSRLWLLWIGVGAALAWYNWTRFGAVSEFGTNLMLSGENVRLARQNEIDLLVRGMFHYFVAPWRWQSDLPLPQLRPLLYPTPIETGYIEELVAGLAPLLPASLAGVVLYFCQPSAGGESTLAGGAPRGAGRLRARRGRDGQLSHPRRDDALRHRLRTRPPLASVTGFVAVVATSRPGWHSPVVAGGGYRRAGMVGDRLRGHHHLPVRRDGELLRVAVLFAVRNRHWTEASTRSTSSGFVGRSTRPCARATRPVSPCRT